MKVQNKNDDDLFISIIVPVYNSEKYLRQCIGSVLCQTYFRFELILIDDGSEDNSGIICDEYAKKDTRVIVMHKKNEGPTTARKIGAQIAIGEYVIFLDSDDYFADGILSKLSEILIKYEVDAIIFNGIRFGKNQIEKNWICQLKAGLYVGKEMDLIKNSLILDENDEIVINYGVCMKVFRRTDYIIFQNKVPKELYKGEDLAVIAPLLANCSSIYISDVCGYFYRDTPGSLMNSFHEDEWMQVKCLVNYLSQTMDSFYERRINSYMVTHLFDYLDRAIVVNRSYSAYRKMVRNICDNEFLIRMERAQCHSRLFNEKLVFLLMKQKLFTLLWILRKVKKRKG